MLGYRASKFDCDACALKSKCHPNTPARKIRRSIYEGNRDFARDIARNLQKMAKLIPQPTPLTT
jgi:hypothetical protein